MDVFDGSDVPRKTIEGRILRRAWRIEAPGLTPLQVMVPLRQQLSEAGYRIFFECAAVSCGGFDFRFGIEVLPGPNMYVNISQFRYLTAMQGPEDRPDKVASVLASVTAGAAYVQVVTAERGAHRAPVPDTPPPASPETADAGENAPQDLESLLVSEGHVVLGDLDFATGSTELGPGPHASLAALAELMRDRDGLRLALVGHTDAVGDLALNVDLSRARAQSVLERLVGAHGADPARLEAQGMGYLAPVASNLTAEGRARNRRVEAIILGEE